MARAIRNVNVCKLIAMIRCLESMQVLVLVMHASYVDVW